MSGVTLPRTTLPPNPNPNLRGTFEHEGLIWRIITGDKVHGFRCRVLAKNPEGRTMRTFTYDQIKSKWNKK